MLNVLTETGTQALITAEEFQPLVDAVKNIYNATNVFTILGVGITSVGGLVLVTWGAKKIIILFHNAIFDLKVKYYRSAYFDRKLEKLARKSSRYGGLF